MDVREGRQGVRGLQGRPWTLVSKCCWSHFELRGDKKIVVLLKKLREEEKNFREKARFHSINCFFKRNLGFYAKMEYI